MLNQLNGCLTNETAGQFIDKTDFFKSADVGDVECLQKGELSLLFFRRFSFIVS